MTANDEPESGDSRDTSVFVSYSRVEQEHAKRVIDLLDGAGFTVWWDGMLKPGVTYVESTEEALESAEAVVVLWSATSVGSNWVRDEAMSGRNRHRLVPISLDGSIAPLGFRQFQAIDFSNWKGGHDDPAARQLVQAVAEMHGREFVSKAPARTAGPARFSRRAMLIAGGGLAAVTAGGLAFWKSGLLEPATATNSIAVLPFRNLSGDTEQEYFAAGLAEELRVILSLNPQLLVAAETSTRIYEDSEEGLDTIAERLGVAYVLEGAVRRTANQVRVTARLIEVASGFDVWSQVFERDFDATLELHSDLATSVVDQLFASEDVGGSITERPGGTGNSEALDHYMLGLALLRRAESEEMDRAALREFERAIAIDPGYAIAHAIYGWGLMLVAASHSSGAELADFRQRAEAEAREAIALAPNAPEGHAALGYIKSASLDLRAAEEPYRTSFDLGFGNAQILGAFAQYSSNIGDFDAARDAIARAERIDPLNAQVFRNAGIIEFAARNFDAAKSAAQAALSLNPDVSSAWSIIGDIALLENDLEEAGEAYAKDTADLVRLRGQAIVADRLEGREAGQAKLDELIARYADNSLYQQAQVLAARGDTEAALTALEAGLAKEDPGLMRTGVDPLLDPIRQEPRFRAILASLGLPEGE
ncbi:TIR domain-containing protein [Erythrobacter alti]|uniref:TIR domain-containing protein n=1 Tax=Erythrobacter alti TaxID=1896145 RepID=UPI0030F431DC